MMPYDRRSARRYDAGHLIVESDPIAMDRFAALGMGVTLDINEHGVRIQNTKPFTVGDRWRFSIALGDDIIDVIGRVVHVTQVLNGSFESGVEFLEIAGSDIRKIREHVIRRAS